MSISKQTFTNVLVRFDSAVVDKLTSIAEGEGRTRTALIQDLVDLAFEHHVRSGEALAEFNRQRIIAATQRSHLDAIEREGGIEDMRAATEALYDLGNRLREIRERRQQATWG